MNRPLGVFAALVALSFSDAHSQGSQHGLRFHGGASPQQDRVRIAIDDDQPGPDQSAPGDVGAGSFTVELWIRGTLVDNNTGNAGGDVEWAAQTWRAGNLLVDRDVLGASGAEWGISVAGGVVRFGTGSGADGSDTENTIEGSTLVLDGTWHHVACVRDVASGTKSIFVDGALDFQSSPGVSHADLSYPDDGVPGGASFDPYLVLAADKHDGGADGFTGFVDELRLWSTTRDASQILSTYDRLISDSEAGLVGWYRFEEGSGIVVADASAQSGPAGVLIAGAPGNGEWTSYQADNDSTAPISFGLLPPGFTRSVVATGFTEPTTVATMPDGRLLVGERSGVVSVIDAGGTLLGAPMITLATNNDFGERGLFSVAVDANFPAEPYLYCFYTTTEPKDRVSRFMVSGNVASPSSELLLWEHDEPASKFHHAGGLAFGNDGTLFIAVGDQLDSDNAQDLGHYGGKILRVNKGGGVPVDNPFVGSAGARPEIYAYGLRNPFRIAVDADDGVLYIGDVGGNTNDAYEEVNVGVAGANYGWPLQEGKNCYTIDCSPFEPSIWSYLHFDPTYFFATPQGSVTLGPMYRGDGFPPEYRGNLYVADYANRFIRRLIFDHGEVVADPVFLTKGLAGTPVDLDVGPDGALYYVTYGLPFGGVPDTATVYRIEYTGDVNQPPIVVAQATPSSGPTPLQVQFSTAGTFDPDAGPGSLSYLWDFGDGNTSTAPNPQHTYATPGPYSARVTVSDGAAATASDPIAIAAGNAPSPSITAPLAGALYQAGQSVSFLGTATDVEDGVLPASAFSWSVVLVHNEHVHPFVGPLVGVTSGSFTPPTTGHGPENTFYRIELTVTDSDGLKSLAVAEVHPQPSLIAFGSIPPGGDLFLDGEPLVLPEIYHGVVGFQHDVSAPPVQTFGGQPYAFRCWSNGQPIDHVVTAGVEGENLTALYEPLPTSAITAAVGAPSQSAEYSPVTGQVFAHPSDPLGVCVGRDSNGVLQAGLQFDLAVPNGAFILSATLDVVATADQAVTPKATIHAYDVGDALPFVSGSPTPISDHAPLTQVSVGWVLPEFFPGQTYSSPELATLVQEVVDRPDWTSGNTLGLSLDGSSTISQQWRCFGNFAATSPPVLRVAYAVLPPQGGACPLPCGFRTYGPTSAVHKLALVGTGTPASGNTVSFVTSGLGSAPGAYVFFGLAEGSLPFFGGTLLIAPAQLLVTFFVPATGGTATWNLPLSNDPQFVGLKVYTQSAAVDPSLPIGAAFSNGVELTICPP